VKKRLEHITVAIALSLVGCATPIKVHSASTTQLMERRAHIDRKLREDDLGVAWGISRWISHASEKHKMLKEREDIDAELAHRHMKIPQSATPSSDKPR
jgi:hypothetical protein